MTQGGMSFLSMANALKAVRDFTSRHYAERKSIFFSKPDHERELPQSNLRGDEQEAAFERERERRSDDE